MVLAVFPFALVSSSSYCCEKKTTNKINLGINGLISPFIFIIWENQGRTLDTGTEAEAVEGGCLLACSLRFVQPVFLPHPGLPAQGWHCSQRVGLSHVNHRSRKYITILPSSQSCGIIYSTEVPSSKMTLTHIKLI